MDYATLRSTVQTRLNRRDVTASLIDTFVQAGMQRAERVLNTPAMEVIADLTITDPSAGIPIPGDYIRLSSMSINDLEARRESLSRVQRIRKSGQIGDAYCFARHGSEWVIAPIPQAGDVVEIVYEASYAGLIADTASNWLTENASDIIILAALVEGCTHFTDPRKADFDQQFKERVTDINLRAAEDELTNAAIEPAYEVDNGAYDMGW